MGKPIATEIHDKLVFAGFKARAVQWGVVRLQSVAAADQIVDMARALPEPIVLAVLRDNRHTSDAAVIAAFREAQELQKLCAMPQMRVLPESVRNMGLFIEQGPNGEERVTPLSDARKRLVDELAKMDVHIDTAPRAMGTASQAARAGSFEGMASHVYAKADQRRGAAK
jgi:hypothetical protein